MKVIKSKEEKKKLFVQKIEAIEKRLAIIQEELNIYRMDTKLRNKASKIGKSEAIKRAIAPLKRA